MRGPFNGLREGSASRNDAPTLEQAPYPQFRFQGQGRHGGDQRTHDNRGDPPLITPFLSTRESGLGKAPASVNQSYEEKEKIEDQTKQAELFQQGGRLQMDLEWLNHAVIVSLVEGRVSRLAGWSLDRSRHFLAPVATAHRRSVSSGSPAQPSWCCLARSAARLAIAAFTEARNA